jgi:hypothetical protein
MSVTTNDPQQELHAQLTQLERAASHLIARLADRAAYATGEEFQEIRELITMLRQLGNAGRDGS